MTTLNEILSTLPADDRARIAPALELMNRQAIGAERFRSAASGWSKDDKSPVTIADLLHQSQVQQMIHDRFAGDGLICEEPRSMQEQVIAEASKVAAEFYGSTLRPEVVDLPETGRVTWILDPIDGTKGYLAGRFYAIALGYFVDGAPQFGAMAVPHGDASGTGINRALAFAVRGRGAWIGRVAESGAFAFEQLRSAAAGIAAPYRVAMSLEHGGNAASIASGPSFQSVKMDSQAKYLGVAADALDAYIRQARDDGGTDVAWDHMPGILIAQEAGATVTNFDGSPVDVRAERVIRFRGGMICHRGPVDGPLAMALRKSLAG